MSLARNFSALQKYEEESGRKENFVKNFLKSRLMNGKFNKQSLLLVLK